MQLVFDAHEILFARLQFHNPPRLFLQLFLRSSQSLLNHHKLL